MATKQGACLSLAALDPRMKLIILFVFTSVAYMASSLLCLAFMYALIVLLFVWTQTPKEAAHVFALFACLLLLDYGTASLSNGNATQSILMILYIIERVSVIFVMSFWMSISLKVGDFVTAMQNMHVPKGLTITLAVVFRYIPTVKEEFGCIKTAMALRGIHFSPKNFLLHPLQTTEFVIVPLMMRSLKIADELSASAMTRGLNLHQTRTCYRDVRLKVSDIALTALIVAVVFLGNYAIRGIV